VTGHSGPFLVHGMGKDPAEPDWEPLHPAEVSAVLAHYPELGAGLPAARQPGRGQLPSAGPPGGAPLPSAGATGGLPQAGAGISWRSPRPMSAAALARLNGRTVFVKRHHHRVRAPAQLAVEHAFAGHLRHHGLAVPAVLRTAGGGTALRRADWVYEVHARAEGADLYRGAVSWTGYASPGHAWAAGAALARLHLAAAGFGWPARPPAVLMNSCEIITASCPLAAVRTLARRRPALGRYLVRRRWEDDLRRHLLPAIATSAPLLGRLPRQWGHGDWHPSNLTWTSASGSAEVVTVFDFGLANRTAAVHDLAIALERATVTWLNLAGPGGAEADLAAVDALLDGYASVRPLSRAEAAALAAVLPVAQVEYALSEVEYFTDVVRSAENADLAYDGYLLGHARWFAGPAGTALLRHLAARAQRAAPGARP
jgi:Ser/Thr protein kinase RdoA (MazF antagonist)